MTVEGRRRPHPLILNLLKDESPLTETGRAGRPNRHSRVSGNPDGTEKTIPLPSAPHGIPAYAGMTVEGRRRPHPLILNLLKDESPLTETGRAGRPNRHSRVSGNPDGTEKTIPLPATPQGIPAYAGMTVGDAAAPAPLQYGHGRL